MKTNVLTNQFQAFRAIVEENIRFADKDEIGRLGIALTYLALDLQVLRNTRAKPKRGGAVQGGQAR